MKSPAICFDGESQLHIRSIDQEYVPGDTEVLVEVKFSGVNPADVLHGQGGLYESVAGYDFAGIVVKVGPLQECRFKPGDRVYGFAPPRKDLPAQYGAHQAFHVARDRINLVPDGVTLEEASILPIVTNTAADMIFNILGLPFDGPPFGQRGPPLLIWGGASIVGYFSIQFAKKAGCYPILTTASVANHPALLEAGATQCFDYHDFDAVEQIRAAVKKFSSQGLAHVLAAVGPGQGDTLSMPVCESCCENPETAMFATAIPAAGDIKQKWTMTFACRNIVNPWGSEEPILQPHYEWHLRNIKAMDWAVGHIRDGFILPPIEVISKADKALDIMNNSAAGKSSFKKYALKHPLKG